jgi:hypothetical protein
LKGCSNTCPPSSINIRCVRGAGIKPDVETALSITAVPQFNPNEEDDMNFMTTLGKVFEQVG